ncbi:MAG: A/G-specific adenine glycosylase [Bacteroidota bacterium]|nr:A/G-specific adenine glycosylase [Bacteroidota bacterium]
MKKSSAAKALGQAFTTNLLQWNEKQNRRQMPWKGEKDPYKIWLSEVILQQTRVEQGLAYYNRFVQAFPTVHHLASAPEQQVFKLWEGLGYYTRCKNLIASAHYISEDLKGVFPADYASIVQLKGVGPYTAAAIASFAYNLPYAVLDGNVFRVLARIFGNETPVDSTGGKKLFSHLAQQLLPPQQAGTYNQAIMDFGATVCKPQPDCAVCFFNNQCIAFLRNKQLLLPVKTKQNKLKERWFHYIVIQHKDAVALYKRTAKDIWQNLYEPLLIESDKSLSKNNLLAQLKKSYSLSTQDYEVISAAAQRTQRLSHQQIHFSFIHLLLHKKRNLENNVWVSKEDLHNYPFPKTVHEFLSKNIS